MPKCLLTNDDGIGEPGLQALYQACEGVDARIVVAPASTCSGIGHAVTTQSPIAVNLFAPNWYSVRGTPADCSRLGTTQIAPDAEWLLAGVNRGGNLGVDIFTSGTVAAAREAAILGYRAIALSQYVRRNVDLDWEWTAREAARVLRQLMAESLAPGHFYNVNLPHLSVDSPPPEIIHCQTDSRPFDVRFRRENVNPGESWLAHYQGIYAERERTDGFDIDVCFGGNIAVSILAV